MAHFIFAHAATRVRVRVRVATQIARRTAMPQVDGFSRIRSQLENKIFPKRFRDADGERDEKVIARTYDCYVSEQPAKTFLDFERRALHRYTGFDSLAHVPYRPFAGLKHTDAYRLIEDAMGLSFLRTDIHQVPFLRIFSLFF